MPRVQPRVKPPGLSFAGPVAAGVGDCAKAAEEQATQNTNAIPKRLELNFNSRLHVFVYHPDRATRCDVLETFRANAAMNPGIEVGNTGFDSSIRSRDA